MNYTCSKVNWSAPTVNVWNTCRSGIHIRHVLVLLWHPQCSRGFNLSTCFDRNPRDRFQRPKDLKQLDFGLNIKATRKDRTNMRVARLAGGTKVNGCGSAALSPIQHACNIGTSLTRKQRSSYRGASRSLPRCRSDSLFACQITNTLQTRNFSDSIISAMLLGNTPPPGFPSCSCSPCWM